MTVKPAKVGESPVPTACPMAISSAFTVTPVPAPIFRVTVPVVPPPVNPEPAVTPSMSPSGTAAIPAARDSALETVEKVVLA